MARRGDLHQVVKDLYYPLETIARLAAIVRELAERDGGTVAAAGFCDATGLGRKRAIARPTSWPPRGSRPEP
ncbi:MAG: hypothetical protein KF755_04800 [Burkholderiaceae bacterium]|nr:hypothetical protein [Burkholderiaceae bacterium]